MAAGPLSLLLAQACLVIGGGWVLWSLACAVRSWHRLRHIPGPFLAPFGHLWLLRHNLTGHTWESYRDLSIAYPGRLVRIGPNLLTTNDPDLIRRMSIARSRYGKDRWYVGGRFNPVTKIMFNQLDPKVHDAAKSKMAVAYSGAAVAALEPTVDKQLSSLVGLIRRKYLSSSAELKLVEFGNLLNYLTLDIITKASFGQEFGYLAADSDIFGFLEETRNVIPIVSLTLDIPWIRDLVYSGPFQTLFGPKLTDKKGFGRLMGVGRSIVEKRFASGGAKRDEADILARFMGNGMSLEECESEAVFLVIAGSETVASAMRITVLSIMTHPLVYAKLKAEIHQAIRDGRASSPIRNEEAKKLPYLQAVIYEGLRMRPPSLNLFTKSTPPEGDTIDGVFVPGNVGIGHNIASMLARTDLFGMDAQLFRPERFLEADPERRARMERDIELAFGYGRWMCAGKSIALLELNKTYFELLRYFELEVADPKRPWISSSYSTHRESNMWVRVTEAEPVV